MKIYFTLFLLILASCFSAAYAGTIKLASDKCIGGLNPICSNVPNNADATIAYFDWAAQACLSTM